MEQDIKKEIWFTEQFKEISAGTFAGCLTAVIDQPGIATKNAKQRGITSLTHYFSKNPLLFFEGLIINMASIGPITGLQVCADSILSNIFNPQTLFGQGMSASGGGSIASFIAGPVENIILQQQQVLEYHSKHIGPIQATKNVINTYGWKGLFRGLESTILRDGPYTASYLVLTPYFASLAKKYTAIKHDLVTILTGGSTAGILAAVATQPFDVIKTKLQTNLRGDTYPNFFSTVKAVYTQRGLTGFFDGLIGRGIRTINGTTATYFVYIKTKALLSP